MKTNKSFTKRIRVTKNGKLVARRPGQNHFNARQTGRQRLARKRNKTMDMSERLVRRFLPGNAGRAKKIADTEAHTDTAAFEANVTKS